MLTLPFFFFCILFFSFSVCFVGFGWCGFVMLALDFFFCPLFLFLFFVCFVGFWWCGFLLSLINVEVCYLLFMLIIFWHWKKYVGLFEWLEEKYFASWVYLVCWSFIYIFYFVFCSFNDAVICSLHLVNELGLVELGFVLCFLCRGLPVDGYNFFFELRFPNTGSVKQWVMLTLPFFFPFLFFFFPFLFVLLIIHIYIFFYRII